MYKIRYYLLSVFILSLSMMHAKNSQPDFAYPQTVAKNAEAALDKAIAADDALSAMRCLIELNTANLLVDPDALPVEIRRAESVESKFRSSYVSPVFILYRANLVRRMYQADRWNYDRRELPLNPRPADMTEWSGAQFSEYIKELCLQAHDGIGKYDLGTRRINDFIKAGVVVADELTVYFYPTLRDFVYSQAVNLLRGSNNTKLADEMCSEARSGLSQDTPSYYTWISRAANLDANPLEALVNAYTPAHGGAGLILAEIADRTHVDRSEVEMPDGDVSAFAAPSPTKILADINAYLDKYPTSVVADRLKAARQRLTAKSAVVSFPRLAAPKQTIDVQVKSVNSPRVIVGLYKVPDAVVSDYRRRHSYDFSSQTPVVSVSLEFPETPVFSVDTVIKMTIPATGYYAVVPVIPGEKAENTRDRALLRSVPAIPVAINGCTKLFAAAVDPISGKPMDKIGVAIVQNSTVKASSITDTRGIAEFASGKVARGQIRLAVAGAEYLFDDVSAYGSTTTARQNTTYSASVLTDRSIYHPGDRLNFLAIISRTISGTAAKPQSSVAPDIPVNVTLLNANSEPVDTVECTSDAFGRVYGHFTIPAGSDLTGTYRVRVSKDGNDGFNGYGYVTVSDYRMPDFEIKDVVVARNTPSVGAVTLTGAAVTYSGMPLADADVSVILSTANRFRWYAPAVKIYSTSVATGADGRFSIEFVDSVFKDYKSEPYFVAAINAVSPSGTTATAQAPISLGKPDYIVVDISNSTVDARKLFRFDVNVFNPEGTKVDIPLLYSITPANEANVVASLPLSLPLDLSALRPGSYRLTVAPVDSALADPAECILTVYNPATDIVPSTDAIWTPTQQMDIPESGDVEVMFGTPLEQAWVYFALCSENDISVVDVKKVGKGYHTHKFSLPADAERSSLMLFAVSNTRTYSREIMLTRKKDTALKIVGESFRDRLVPGAEETWRIKITNADGTPASAALALDMYNMALEALAPHSFSAAFPDFTPYPSISVDYPWNGSRSNHFVARYASIRYKQLFPPVFETFDMAPGYSFVESALEGSAYGIGVRKMMSPAMKAESVTDEMAVNTSAGVMQDLAGGVEEEVSADAEGSAAPEASQQQVSFDYRDADVPMAVWAPALATDADGSVVYTFKLPNANTTWRLRAASWTKDLRHGSLVRDFIASKPVMVMPNLPRFLRSGDTASVVAVVMNNADSAACVNTVIELFDPVSNKIISTETFTDSLAAKASSTVAITVATPGMNDMTAIGYRIRSSANGFTDGEQSVIRILPSMAELVETTPFYLNPGQKSYTTVLPSDPGARISLTFCENPVWTVVSALPGLRENMSDDANSAAAAMFSACVSRGIIKGNPAVAAALKQWIDNPSDSALVSMLEKNEDLKIAVLNSTPWLQAARSDSERMARLALIFNNKEVDKSISASLTALRKLQRADGGWAWGSWSQESSVWVTSNVLDMMAQLTQFGWLPSDKAISSMIDKALKYYDKSVRDTDMAYALIRPQFSAPISSNGRSVIAKTVQDIVRNWKKYTDPAYKSLAAEALYRNNYKSMARQIMKSVAQFGVTTPSQGMRFPSVNALSSYACILRAFALIDPQSPAVDGLRQQLIVRKQGSDWGSAVVTAEVVSSILSTGSCWTVPAQGAVLSVSDDIVLPKSPMQSATGSITADLSRYAGDTLHISTPGVGPAYGAVFAQFSRRMEKVQASSCDDLSIEKTITLRSGTGWTPLPDTLHVGDRLKVQLTIHCKRNLQYLTIIDDRAATLEPVDQLPGWIYSDGVGFYRENRDSRTCLYIDYMRPGTYLLTYEMNVNLDGTFSSGVATIQSQYAPELSAHSAGGVINVATSR